MTSYFRRAPLGPSENIMTDDDFSEIEIGRDGKRVYKERRPRTQTNFVSQALLGSMSNSVGGSQSIYGGSHLAYEGYSRSQFDNRSVRSHRGFSPESFRSMRLESDFEEIKLQRIQREINRRLQQIHEEKQWRPPRKRRRPEFEFQRDSEENTDDSYEDDRLSTRSEYAIRYVKRSRREMRHPYARIERTFIRGEPIRSHWSHSALGKSQLADTFHHRAASNVSHQPLMRSMSAMREIDLRNLNCTAITEDTTVCDKTQKVQEPGKENTSAKVIDRHTELTQKDHVFMKPRLPPSLKQLPPTFTMPAPPIENSTNQAIPSKINNHSKRLSDVSEIPEATQNSSNDSMRPSFIKRKLFTQTLDVGMEKDSEKEDSLSSESPLPNIYSSVPRPKVRPGTSTNSRPFFKRNIFDRTEREDTGSIRDLIERIVPHDKMNATTGNLQKNAARSSIHKAKSDNVNDKIPSNEAARECIPKESDYDTDIIGEIQTGDTNTQLKITEVDKLSLAHNAVQQNNHTKKNNERKERGNNKIKASNTDSREKDTSKSKEKVDSETTKKANNVTRKLKNNDSHPEKVRKMSSKEPSNEETCVNESAPEKSQGAKHKNNMEKLRNSISCLVNSCKDKRMPSDDSKQSSNSRVSSATDKTNKKSESSKQTDINKVLNNLESDKQACSTGNKRTVNELRMNKRSASSQPINKPSKVMKAQSEVNQYKPRSQSASGSKETRNNESQKKVASSSEEELEISFRRDNVYGANSSEELDLPKSRRVSVRPSRLIDEIGVLQCPFKKLSVRKSTRKSVRPFRYSDYLMQNTPKESRRSTSHCSTGKKRGSTKEKLEKQRPRSVSPTYTMSDVDFTSPKKAAPHRQLANCKDVRKSRRVIVRPSRLINELVVVSRLELRRSPRVNVNSAGSAGVNKCPGPAYKVIKQKILFGRKANSPSFNSSRHKEKVESEKVQNQKKVQDDAIDSFLEDSSDDFTEESLQRSRSFNSSQKTTQKPVVMNNDLDSSIVKRSAPKADGETRQGQSQDYNQKKKNISSFRKSLAPVRSSPRIANRTKASEHPPTVESRRPEPAMARGDSFLESSEEESTADVRIPATTKPLREWNSTNVQPRKVSTLAKKIIPTKQTPKKMNSSTVTEIAKQAAFKPPLPVVKAPRKANVTFSDKSFQARMTQPKNTANMSMSSTMSCSSLQSNARKNSKLPQKLRELLGSDFEEHSEEDPSVPEFSSINERIDQMKRKEKEARRNKNAASPTRSDITVRSEMIRPPRNLINRAARTFNTTQNASQYVYASHDDTRRRRHDLGMTTLTGFNPSFSRCVNSTRNQTRFDSNASVVSSHSIKSFSSLSGKRYIPMPHF